MGNVHLNEVGEVTVDNRSRSIALGLLLIIFLGFGYSLRLWQEGEEVKIVNVSTDNLIEMLHWEATWPERRKHPIIWSKQGGSTVADCGTMLVLHKSKNTFCIPLTQFGKYAQAVPKG